MCATEAMADSTETVTQSVDYRVWRAATRHLAWSWGSGGYTWTFAVMLWDVEASLELSSKPVGGYMVLPCY